MSIYTQNRLSESRFGTGLPFYLNIENQERFAGELYVYGTVGMWQCPSNRLPTWQIRCPDELKDVEIVPTNGKEDGTAILIDSTNVQEVSALDEGDPFFIAFTQEVTRAFTLCGTYYFRLTFNNNAVWYSEVFYAGGYCGASIELTANVVQVNMDDTVDVEFEFTANAKDTSAATATILGLSYGVGQFTVNNIPVGNSIFTTSVETENCGTFNDSYSFRNLGAGVTTYTKQYL